MPFVLKKVLAGVVGATGLVLALTTPPQAQQPTPQGMVACRSDVATFCRGIEAGGGKRLSCLLANQTSLQPSCAAAVQARLTTRDAAGGSAKGSKGGSGASAIQAQAPTPGQPAPPIVQQQTAPAAEMPPVAGRIVPARPAGVRPMAACRSDLQALCGSVQPGGGARVRCLRENQAKLSQPCNAALATISADGQARRGAMKSACRDDVRQLCAGRKGPERRQCLASNADKLSAGCAAALKPS